MGPSPGDVETSEKNRYVMGARANLYRNGKIERHDAAALLKQPVMEGQLRWAGVDDHYFLSAVLSAAGNVPASTAAHDPGRRGAGPAHLRRIRGESTRPPWTPRSSSARKPSTC